MTKFFDEKKPSQIVERPTLTGLLKATIDSAASQIKVCVPAKVIKYDSKTQVLDAQPVFKRKQKDGTVTDSPIIYSIPVAFPRAGDAFVHLPIKSGNSVLLLFSDNSLEKWLASGELNEPEDTRKHHIADAIAIPGGYPFTQAASVANGSDIIIKNEDSEMRIRTDGKMQVLNQSHEMLKAIDEFMTRSLSGDHWGALRARNKFKTFVKS